MESDSRSVTKNEAYFNLHGFVPQEAMVETDADKCLEILKDIDLFKTITEKELGKNITGEQESVKSTFLSLCSIWLNDMDIPMNTMLSSESSAGKSYVSKKIVDLFPKELVEWRSKISGEAFTYWHTNEDDWTWDGKILFLEDISQAVLDSSTFKLMCSEGSYATVVKKQKAENLKVNGKPCMLITTASTTPNTEIMNRFNVLHLDESAEQTRQIVHKKSLGIRNKEYDPKIINSLRLLKKHSVKIPFGEMVYNYITANYGWDNIRMRRDFDRMLSLIRCSTTLHQYQRSEINGELIATEQDYEIARNAINYMQGMTLKGLVHKLQKAYEFCKEETSSFSAKTIHAKNPFVSPTIWYDYLDELCSKGLLSVEFKAELGVFQLVKHYSIKKSANLILPKFHLLI